MKTLLKRRCFPCKGGTLPLTKSEIKKLMSQVNGWKLDKRGWLIREYKMKNFLTTIKFINKIGKLAERENHHPNIYLYSWNRLRLELYTHSIGGLSTNDFVLAAKINALR